MTVTAAGTFIVYPLVGGRHQSTPGAQMDMGGPSLHAYPRGHSGYGGGTGPGLRIRLLGRVKGHVVGEGAWLGNHDRHDELLRPYTLQAWKPSPQSLFAPPMYI
ncbi:hypothetical protein CLCR_11064 [Cladophialophora carrionii]|uniref:Uncharacterized protein n=1 Tax=Cladophialophora carrionii TaxID=86049 RepID=A0A1C1CZJ7_9EURO|nr:hypothetical protein CLCR_11064 [Cladophialophora carrionii]